MLWRAHHLINRRTTFDFLGKRRLALVASTIINVLSIVGVFTLGLNFGIDFEGGIAIQVRAKQGDIHLENLRTTTGDLGVGEVTLQEFGDNKSALIRVQRQEGNAQCVAHADKVMKKRAGNGWSVVPGLVAVNVKGPPEMLQTHSVRMNLRPGSRSRLLVCHSRSWGFSDFWPTIGFFTTASLK